VMLPATAMDGYSHRQKQYRRLTDVLPTSTIREVLDNNSQGVRHAWSKHYFCCNARGSALSGLMGGSGARMVGVVRDQDVKGADRLCTRLFQCLYRPQEAPLSTGHDAEYPQHRPLRFTPDHLDRLLRYKRKNGSPLP